MNKEHGPQSSRVITRFAPAPTGRLHIGGARTALFNWLFAKSQGGLFLLRIDDTDFARSAQSHTDNIINSLRWLGIDWHNMNNETYQSTRLKHYQEVVNSLVDSGHAYHCYATQEDESGSNINLTPNERKTILRSYAVRDKYTIRFKMDMEGGFTVCDTIAGELYIEYKNLDDITLIREDGIATYMAASVIDDYDHGITHIIRGKEHLNNTYRQIPIIKALGYNVPSYSHIALIHDEEGKKLSKRIDSTSIYDYQSMGILPEALSNYMLRLGWGHGNTDIITMEEAKLIFGLDGLRGSPARFDLQKLLSLNSHYIKNMSEDDLMSRLDIPEHMNKQVRMCLKNMQEKADTLQYINEMSRHIFSMPIPHYFDTPPELSKEEALFIRSCIQGLSIFDFEDVGKIKSTLDDLILKSGLDKRKLLMFLRIALTGMKVSPGLFEVMRALGPELCARRIHELVR
jgi:glutamyl-tRNA synthetase